MTRHRLAHKNFINIRYYRGLLISEPARRELDKFLRLVFDQLARNLRLSSLDVRKAIRLVYKKNYQLKKVHS